MCVCRILIKITYLLTYYLRNCAISHCDYHHSCSLPSERFLFLRKIAILNHFYPWVIFSFSYFPNFLFLQRIIYIISYTESTTAATNIRDSRWAAIFYLRRWIWIDRRTNCCIVLNEHNTVFASNLSAICNRCFPGPMETHCNIGSKRAFPTGVLDRWHSCLLIYGCTTCLVPAFDNT